MNPWIQYSVIRLAIFAGALALLLLLGVDWLVAAIIAALLGLCISYIFFRREREAVAGSIAARMHRQSGDIDSAGDDAAEDEAIDRAN